MHILIDGYEPLCLPDPDPTKIKAKFDHHTSYLDRLHNRLRSGRYCKILLPLKLQCLKALALRIRPMIEMGEMPLNYLETMAGIGLTARLFEPFCQFIRFNEIDDLCIDVLVKNFPKCSITMEDAYSFQNWMSSDIIFADFNNFTLRKFLSGEVRRAADSIFKASTKYVIINDCSLFYFRYGKKSYEVYSGLLGRDIRSKKDYFQELREFYIRHYPEWKLIEVQYFSETSFLLFEKTDQPREFYAYENSPEEALRLTIS